MTPAMHAELERLVKLKLPESYVRNGFTGLPTSNLDMRSIAALEKRGLVESAIHRWRAPYDASDTVTLTYHATAAGRALVR